MARTPSQQRVRLALAQVNTTVGDVRGNADLVLSRIEEARRAGAQLVVFPELVTTGYPPEDLLLKDHFLASVEAELARVAAGIDGIVAVLGTAERSAAGAHNSAAVLAEGRIVGHYRKVALPNYGVFDERRYFEPGDGPALIELGGLRVGLTICEDVWFPGPPASSESLAGAGLIVNLSASPYQRGKPAVRERMIQERARENECAFALCNAVGGQDELVFDGHSVIVDQAGQTIARAEQFAEELLLAEVAFPAGEPTEVGSPERPAREEARVIASLETGAPGADPPASRIADELEPEEAEVRAALVLGLRDYVAKNGFGDVVLGLSGGIDSALVALIATEALGPERVRCVIMPSPHSSAETQSDAREIAARLGVEAIEIEIGAAMKAYSDLLPPAAEADEKAVALADENVQARIRGTLLMALSNRHGWLVLTTGNKSELSVGYATLYGDMAGGFAVIKDVPKGLVYGLVRHCNERAGRELVPASVIERAPTAELRPDQRDEDSLPPYEMLDRILEAYIEGDRSRDEIVAAGLEPDLVDEVLRLVDRAEYKRRQAPPGIKISPKAFGRDRRLPITNRFPG